MGPRDYANLNQWRWSALKVRDRFYAVRMSNGKYIYIHRLIAERAGCDISRMIDHLDGDGLNNLRGNLRAATNAQNLQNRGMPSNNASGYKGVLWDSARNKWRAEIRADGKRYFLGRFYSKQQAARVYVKAAKKLHGRFAHDNRS